MSTDKKSGIWLTDFHGKKCFVRKIEKGNGAKKKFKRAENALAYSDLF